MSYKASIELEIGGGPYGLGSGIGAQVNLRDIAVSFNQRFCSKHEMTVTHEGTCSFCEDDIRRTVRNLLGVKPDEHAYYPGSAASTPSDYPYVNCANIKHTHECGCHLGHDCTENGCNEHGKAGDHALLQLAAEAPNEQMTSVYARLADLERQNKVLNNVVTKLLEHLPDDVTNAAVTDALREKIGIGAADENGAIGGAESV